MSKRPRGAATLALILSGGIVFSPVLSFSPFAAEQDDIPGETPVEIASTIEEVAQLSQAAQVQSFFTIDAGSGAVEGEAVFEDFGDRYEEVVDPSAPAEEKQEQIIRYLEDTGLYAAEEGEENTVEAVSVYSNMRLILDLPPMDTIQAYGAQSAVYFEDHYLLSYASEEETLAAYDRLVADHGEDVVFIDLPIRAEAVGWGTEYMHLDKKAETLSSGAPVTVAVLDAGMNLNHEIFDGTEIMEPFSVLSGSDADATGSVDSTGHGTAVAGVIAENTPANVRIMPVKIIGEGDEGSAEDMMNGVQYAHEHGADIINLSIGESMVGYERYYSRLVRRLEAYPELMVCAAGNRGLDEDEALFFPSSVPTTVSVSAIDEESAFVPFSNYGESVDFAAPGGALMVAYDRYGTNYGYGSGTSFSAPYVSAAAALILSEHPEYTKDELYDALCALCVDLGESGRDPYYGNGCPVFPLLNGFHEEEGEIFYYVEGEKQYGQKKIDDGWYMFDRESGAMRTGFVHIPSQNKIVYYSEAGDIQSGLGRMQYGQKKIDGCWYMFKQGSGAMQTGFVYIPGQKKTVYYRESGSMGRGLGRMLYGRQKIQGSWYVFKQGTGALLYRE